MDFSSIAAITAAERAEIIERHRAAGVRIPCADGVIIAPSVEIEADTLLLPGTILLGETRIGRGCVIGPNSILHSCTLGDGCQLEHVQGEQASLGADCALGPYVRLRPGTVLGAGLRIGNFVEIKNASIGDGTKIAHLSYIGDADFGANINVGCGLAVANYDGRQKHRTTVGDSAFIGCHNALVAPVSVGAGAYTAAGSVITQDVPEDGFAIARARQVNKDKRGS
ncbi:MAG: UDP-N-acetylglucosamine diphosphorylase [Oscillospiraceae bacterium]|jgi:bifunctional UDP-N-acetylglucosamine pyrophosphorylase/glucosamine-1-phosphate N-acetyltransferase|nr:UDP-N-acetylglucosamine diphosphorylase [Oscillospiraceae bacterium]